MFSCVEIDLLETFMKMSHFDYVMISFFSYLKAVV